MHPAGSLLLWPAAPYLRLCSFCGGGALPGVPRAVLDALPLPPSAPQFEGLLPGEDTQIPGTYHDAMSGSTPLGKAVRSTCDELDALAALEQQTLADAEQLLKSMGWRGSLFDSRSSSSAASSEGATPPKSD